MKRLGLLALAAGALAFSAIPLAAQNVISARSGMVHFASGKVFLDGKPVVPKFGEFPQMREDSILNTEKGRAEVLLSPGVILRMSNESSVKLISSNVSAPELELIGGSFLLECMEIPKKSAVTLRYAGYTIDVRKPGLYRVDSEMGEFRVYDGKAKVIAGGQTVEVKKGRKVAFAAALQVAKFDRKKEIDSFYNWSSYRSYDIARASYSSAGRLYDTGAYWGMGSWVWNPFYSLFTFIPRSGILMSPFGWQFWSPGGYYYAVYAPRYDASRGGGGWNRDLGYSTVPQTSAGSSGTVAAATSGDVGGGRAGGSAPIARDPGGSAGGRGR